MCGQGLAYGRLKVHVSCCKDDQTVHGVFNQT
ncbi:hypothetical protein T06_8375 [Trichinella sp. T6]|nr:hypothetical protein T06_8375 [Trichinella sp. T6]